MDGYDPTATTTPDPTPAPPETAPPPREVPAITPSDTAPPPSGFADTLPGPGRDSSPITGGDVLPSGGDTTRRNLSIADRAAANTARRTIMAAANPPVHANPLDTTPDDAARLLEAAADTPQVGRPTVRPEPDPFDVFGTPARFPEPPEFPPQFDAEAARKDRVADARRAVEAQRDMVKAELAAAKFFPDVTVEVPEADPDNAVIVVNVFEQFVYYRPYKNEIKFNGAVVPGNLHEFVKKVLDVRAKT